MNKRGKTTAFWTAALFGLGFLIAVLVVRESVFEKYYIWRLSSEDLEDRLVAAEDLGRMGSVRAVPRLLEVWKQTSSEPGTPGHPRSALKAVVDLGTAALPALELALKDPSPQVREGAAVAIGWFGEQAAGLSGSLSALVDDESVDVRRTVAFALGQVGPVSIPHLRKLLTDEDGQVRLQALLRLSKFGPAASEALLEFRVLLDDADPTVRNTSVGVIANLGPPGVPVLVEALQRPDRSIRVSAVQALGRMGPAAKDSLDVLLPLAAAEDPDLRGRAIWVIYGISPENRDRLALMRNALKDSDAGIRSGAASALFELGPEGIGTLFMALLDERSDVRQAAMDALSRLDRDLRQLEDKFACRELAGLEVSALPGLIAGLEAKFLNPRPIALVAVGNIGPEAAPAVPAILEHLEDYPEDSLALEALARIGPAAVPELVAALRDIRLRNTASNALERIGTEAVPALILLLGDSGSGLQDEAAYILGRIGPDAGDATPALATLVSDPSPVVRYSAVKALGEIGKGAREAIPVLRNALGDDNAVVRRAAAAALELIPRD